MKFSYGLLMVLVGRSLGGVLNGGFGDVGVLELDVTGNSNSSDILDGRLGRDVKSIDNDELRKIIDNSDSSDSNDNDNYVGDAVTDSEFTAGTDYEFIDAPIHDPINTNNDISITSPENIYQSPSKPIVTHTEFNNLTLKGPKSKTIFSSQISTKSNNYLFENGGELRLGISRDSTGSAANLSTPSTDILASISSFSTRWIDVTSLSSDSLGATVISSTLYSLTTTLTSSLSLISPTDCFTETLIYSSTPILRLSDKSLSGIFFNASSEPIPASRKEYLSVSSSNPLETVSSTSSTKSTSSYIRSALNLPSTADRANTTPASTIGTSTTSASLSTNQDLPTPTPILPIPTDYEISSDFVHTIERLTYSISVEFPPKRNLETAKALSRYSSYAWEEHLTGTTDTTAYSTDTTVHSTDTKVHSTDITAYSTGYTTYRSAGPTSTPSIPVDGKYTTITPDGYPLVLPFPKRAIRYSSGVSKRSLFFPLAMLFGLIASYRIY